MSVQFPAIRPSGRSFTLGGFPTKTYRALSGFTVKRSFGNRAFGYQLSLDFTNIKDALASQLVGHYITTSGGFSRFNLPDAVFAGMDSSLISQIKEPAQIRWEYASPPEVTSVYRDICNVRIQLVGEIQL